MTKSPTEVLRPHCLEHGAQAAIDALRESGWIIVRHDAIRLAQAHARADNDNVSYTRHKAG